MIEHLRFAHILDVILKEIVIIATRESLDGILTLSMRFNVTINLSMISSYS